MISYSTSILAGSRGLNPPSQAPLVELLGVEFDDVIVPRQVIIVVLIRPDRLPDDSAPVGLVPGSAAQPSIGLGIEDLEHVIQGQEPPQQYG